MNITDTIDPKVDQLTADHLIGRTLTIRVTDVRLVEGDQPCDIHYEGGAGLPYRPGRSMRRVLVHVWGGDVKKYIGRSMTLYRDDDVQFGGLKVGGIRIAAMSDITAPVTMALTAKKGSKKAFKVQPLTVETKPASDPALDDARALVSRIRGAETMADLAGITAEAEVIEKRATLKDERPKLAERINAAVSEMLEGFEAAPMRDPGEEG